MVDEVKEAMGSDGTGPLGRLDLHSQKGGRTGGFQHEPHGLTS